LKVEESEAMGTFHDHMGELHGITVVVSKHDGCTWIGRCHSEDAIEVILHDADLHDPALSDEDTDQWLQKAKQIGHWPRVSTIRIARPEVSNLVRLAEITPGQGGPDPA
jgi:hypothetical protein